MNGDDPDERTADEVFHPLGEEWQDGLEEAIEETEYDTELGLEMAKDAMRVTEGELSEEEFYDRYHEDVVEEFGEDDRPMADDIESARAGEDGLVENTLARVGASDESRRDVMKKMGAGAGAVGLGAWGTADPGRDGDPAMTQENQSGETEDTHGEGTQWGMALDLEHCDGCLSCVVACAEEHNWNQGANWMYILFYEDHTPGDANNALIRPCQHCTDAPCEKVCPTTARHTRDSDGLVLTDYDVCIGCRYCQVACPYGVNYFQWEEPEVPREELDEDHVYDERGRPVGARAPRGVMEKCTFCATRQDGSKGEEFVGRTACEDACPPEVIQFGDMNDPSSDPQRYLDNTAKSRTLTRTAGELPATDEIESALQDLDEDEAGDIDAIVDAVEDLDEETIAVLLAIAILGEEGEPEGDETGTLAEQESTVMEIVTILEENGLDTQSQDLLVELDLAEEPGEDEEFEGPSEELAQERLEDFAGGVESTFRLLEDIGTDPNVVYLGNQPGPHAEQVPGPVAYEDVNQTDNRKTVLDDGTIGPQGPSL